LLIEKVRDAERGFGRRG